MSDIFKIIHVIAAVLFLGNIIVTAVWKVMADRRKALDVLRFGIDLVILTDILFTFGGAAILIGSGGYMVISYGMSILDTPWLLYGIGCFAVSGFIWLLGLVPNQFKQRQLLRSATDYRLIAQEFERLAMRWNVLGVISTLFAIAAIVFMTVK
ncbi:DUF2269 family protein [Rhizobium paknamense]|uniref:Membrane protein n=1 Tax=Rhizobium paknamense TaxID=1206817 RepID=A0ABU0IDT4_9HYPH|nr:DUF2269 family protein [Rhizobium paknamense]MDQ0456406.1 putative membrane protein [Rhizobium paknamense]